MLIPIDVALKERRVPSRGLLCRRWRSEWP